MNAIGQVLKKGADKVKGTFMQVVDNIDHLLDDDAEEKGWNWESADFVEYCRECRAKFDVSMWKHHCRVCGGVFCESCCRPIEDGDEAAGPTVMLGVKKKGAAGTKKIARKICDGCRRGEVPGGEIFTAAELALKGKRVQLTMVEKTGKRVVASVSKIGEPVKMILDDIVQTTSPNSKLINAYPPPSVPIDLKRGSKYGEDGSNVDASILAALPTQGYFELKNKSREFCAIKLLKVGGDRLWEIARPSYISVPPGGIVHAEVDSRVQTLDLYLLFGNDNPIPTDRQVVFDTHTQARAILPCAHIAQFKNMSVFEIDCFGKNVLLKTHGGGDCVPRLGNGISRVGFIGWLTGQRLAKDKLDLTTNTSSVKSTFSTLIPLSGTTDSS